MRNAKTGENAKKRRRIDVSSLAESKTPQPLDEQGRFPLSRRKVPAKSTAAPHSPDKFQARSDGVGPATLLPDYELTHIVPTRLSASIAGPPISLAKTDQPGITTEGVNAVSTERADPFSTSSAAVWQSPNLCSRMRLCGTAI